jgi:hypothetical protein
MADKQQIGTIAVLDSKEWNDVMLYSFQLEGTGRWFRTGRKAIGYQEGQSIKFMCNHKGVVDDASVEMVTPEQVAEAPKVEPRSASNGSFPRGGARDQYWVDKAEKDVTVGKDIAYQASRNAAIAITRVLYEAEAINYGKSKTAGAKQDSILSLVDELTERFLGEIPSNVEAA